MTEERKQRTHATEAAGRAGRLSRELTIKAQQAKAEGKPVAYSFIVCAYDEIIHAMDVVPVWTENYAGVCAAKRDAQRFLEKAEAENFSRSLCTYALCDLGFDIWRAELGEMPPDAPWRGLVRPDMMLGSGQLVCDPRNKWYQAAQHYMPDVPVYEVGMPWPQYESDYDYREVQDYYVEYIVEQLRGLIEFMEKHTGHKMDWDRLAEMVDITDKTWNLIWDTYELRKAKPCPMDTGDAMNTMVPIAFMMGTQEAYDFFLELNAELKQKIENGEGVIPNEKYRLLWGGGLPSWFALSDFNYFNSKGAVFPAETTYRSFENTRLFDIDLTKISDPLEHIAWRWIKYWTFWYDAARKRSGSHPDVERLIQYIEDYDIDGVVMHEAFSCRTWHPGLIWQLNQLKKIYRDIPSLVLEGDIVDIGSYSEADTHARIDAFIESLESVKSG
ncbi:MAG: 2-hydroxyacyl-CoA dehydratase [Dehalococcoidales bacterium]|nr:MAG: 2-hydroxyacyl-CoA dehydratase [Dehalococcoidales bacterium]